MSKVATCLWFENGAEAAAEFYVSLLPDSRIDHVQRAPADYPGGNEGDPILVSFTLAGQAMQGLNGGHAVPYGTAASISVRCKDQAEVDRLWSALTGDGGQEVACGWLNDRWGVPWQIVPEAMIQLLADPDPGRAKRAFLAMTDMVKLDIAALQRAAAG